MQTNNNKPWWHDVPQHIGQFVGGLQQRLEVRNVTAGFASTTIAATAPALSPQIMTHRTSRSTSASAGTTKEELGRATWTLLHTLAAQYPDNPSRAQRKDVNTFLVSLAKVYPCGDCAEHFQTCIRNDPPDTTDKVSLQQWVCRLHNSVNRRIGKPTFNCQLIGSRWAGLDCGEDSSCDLQLGTKGKRR